MELKYEYRVFGSQDKWTFYSASIQNLETSQRDEIELVKAKHFPNLGKMHVRAVYIRNSKILLMPRIDKHYINLVVLCIIDCSLQEITKDDLQPFVSLKVLSLSKNSIRSLSADLFDNTILIEWLSFAYNKIQFISQKTLAPLLKLKYCDFRDNDTIDEYYDFDELTSASIALPVLKAKIVLQCAPSNEQTSTVSDYVHNLWQGDFSDFKMKTKEEVFNVHKAVLKVNSPVFAAMLSHEMEENVKNEMTIANFCPQTIKEFLAFVYLRQVPKKCFNATDLYAMAEKYQVKELAAHAQWFIVVEVNNENATEMFKFGVLYNNEVIKETAFYAIEKSLNKKLPSNLMKSEDMVELLEVIDKLDEVVKRVTQSHSQNRLFRAKSTM